MLRKVLLVALLPAVLAAQPNAGIARHITWGPNLPVTCSALTGDVFTKTSGTSGAMYQCTAPNVWSVITAGSGITSLNGLTGSSQTFANGTNVTITSTGTTHTLGWTGVLASSLGGSGVANTATLTLGTTNVNLASLATGIVKHTTTTGALTIATSADVVVLWTGTCSSSTFLRGDGACAASGGGITYPAGTGFAIVTGGAAWGTTLADPLAAGHGGSGVANTATLTLGSSNVNLASLGTGLVKNTTTTGALTNGVSADVIGLWSGTCSSSTFLRGDGACAATGGGITYPSGTGFAIVTGGAAWGTTLADPLTAGHGGTGVANTATLTLGSSNVNLASLGTGLVKNTTTTGALTNGASGDVIGLWSGSCSASTFLRGDGACASASGGSGSLVMTTGAGAPVASCTAPSSSNLAAYFNTTASSPVLSIWFCTATNTWTNVLQTTGSGPYVVTGGTGTAPSAPSSGSVTCYFDSTTNTQICIDPSSNAFTMVKGSSGVSNEFVTNIDASGIQHFALPFSLTTTGSSGAATFSGGVLNIPTYSGGGGGSNAVLTPVSFSSSASYVVSANSTPQKWTTTLSGNMTAPTLTATSATTGQDLTLILTQDATGGRAFTFPSNWKANGCVISPTATVVTYITAYWDGSNAQTYDCKAGDSFASIPEASSPATPPSAAASCWADSTDHSGWECKANGSANTFKMVLTGIDINTVTGQVTSGAHLGSTTVPGSALASNAVTSSKMAVVNTYRTCEMAVGDTSGSAITNSQLGPQSRICFVPMAATIVELDVNADGGTPNVIVGRNHAGTIVNIVSGALATAASGGIACSNTGGTTGLNGATTCSSTLQNTSLSAGDYLELVSGTAGGTAKLFVAHVTYTVN